MQLPAPVLEGAKMSGLETNVFPILNLPELVTTYVLARIRGLNPEQAEYYQNRQALIRKLSFSLRSPVTIIERDDEPWLVLRRQRRCSGISFPTRPDGRLL
jgi:hypothetical protein